jgi:hypothetical protein
MSIENCEIHNDCYVVDEFWVGEIRHQAHVREEFHERGNGKHPNDPDCEGQWSGTITAFMAYDEDDNLHPADIDSATADRIETEVAHHVLDEDIWGGE